MRFSRWFPERMINGRGRGEKGRESTKRLSRTPSLTGRRSAAVYNSRWVTWNSESLTTSWGLKRENCSFFITFGWWWLTLSFIRSDGDRERLRVLIQNHVQDFIR